VIKIKLVPIEHLTAILAGIFVALEDIVAGELYFLFGKSIEKQQHNYARHPNLERNGSDDFMFRRGRGKVAPTIEIMSQEIIGIVGGDDMGMPGVNEGEGAARRANINCLPEAIQHQNLTV
jgi:hypothetical protein